MMPDALRLPFRLIFLPPFTPLLLFDAAVTSRLTISFAAIFRHADVYFAMLPLMSRY